MSYDYDQLYGSYTMARRRRPNYNADPDATQNLLGHKLASANVRIDKLAEAVMAATIQPEFGAPEFMRHMFTPDTLRRCIEGLEVTEPFTTSMTYPCGAADVTVDVNKIHMLPPNVNAISPDAERGPMAMVIAHASKVYLDFMLVRHVLKWCNDFCTAGAVRNYWPTAAVLALECDELKGTPRRYDEPTANIAPIIPLMRITASTVAAALMLGDNPPTVGYSEGSFRLSFDNGQHTHYTGAVIELHSRTYNIKQA